MALELLICAAVAVYVAVDQVVLRRVPPARRDRHLVAPPERDWSDAAARLGMQLLAPFHLSGATPESFVIDATASSSDGTTTVVVDSRGAIPGGVALSKTPPSGGPRRDATGDRSFDVRFRVGGDHGQSLAVLTASVRGLLCTIDDSLWVAETRVWLQADSLVLTRDLPDLVRRAQDIARHLACPLDEVPLRLARNAAADPLPEVRRRSLEALLADHRLHPAARGAVDAAMGDPDPRVRVHAARGAGPAGLDFLTEALARADSEQGPIRLGRDDAALRAAVAHLAEHRHVPAAPHLIRLLPRVGREMAVAVAEALGRTGAVEAEEGLIQALGSEYPRLQKAAAAALGELGGLRAVRPLQRLSKGLFVENDVKQAARGAVARIEVRAGPAEGGRLSLADVREEEGSLSLVPDNGALSHAEPAAPGGGGDGEGGGDAVA